MKKKGARCQVSGVRCQKTAKQATARPLSHVAEQLRLFDERPESVPTDPPTKDQLRERLRKLQGNSLVQVAPGLYRSVTDVLPSDVILARLVDRGSDIKEVVPVSEKWARMSEKLQRQLGFTRHAETLFRLGRAGFIEIVQVAPNTHMLNLCSLYGHLARVAEAGDEFWDPSTPQGLKRRKAYREAMFGGAARFVVEPSRGKGRRS
jgi:hypothetical protein